RSGDYTRTLVTRVRKLELRVPQDRDGRFSTELFESGWHDPVRRRPRFAPLRSATPPSGAQNADDPLLPVVSFSMSHAVPFRMSFDNSQAAPDRNYSF